MNKTLLWLSNANIRGTKKNLKLYLKYFMD